MTRVALAVAVIALAACNGSADRVTANPTTPGDGSAHAGTAAAGPVEKLPDPGPPPERDCTLLAPAIDRITAAEVAEIKRTRPPDVAPVAEAEVTAIAATLVKVLPKLCEIDSWPGRYTACVAAARVRDDARACAVHLTADQQAHLAKEMSAPAVAANSIGIPECDQWAAIAMRVETCTSLPEASRKAIAEAVKQSMDAWRQQVSTPDMRESIRSACVAAVDAMKQSMTAMGCPF